MTRRFKNPACFFCFALLFSVISAGVGYAQRTTAMKNTAAAQAFVKDVHSYSNPQAVRVSHVDLDWNVLFDQKALRGTATLTVERIPPITTRLGNLILDTRDLKIERVETSSNGRTFRAAQFKLGAANKILGAPLSITMPSGTKFVRVHYSTVPTASGLQWLMPEQTAGKKIAVYVFAGTGDSRPLIYSFAGFAAGSHNLFSPHPDAEKSFGGDERRRESAK